MKTIILAILFATSISSCIAQTKIASLGKSAITKAKSITFSTNKENGYAYIQNTNNKFSKVKQSSPNLPANVNLYPEYAKIDFEKITKICISHISLKELEELAKLKQSSLFIRIRSDLTGRPIEMQFLTDANSNLSVNQLEEIENELLKATIIWINPKAEKLLQGSNYLVNDAVIYFEDMLKVKRTVK